MNETTAGISHVGFIAINVRDLDRSIAFYAEKLGLTKTTDNTMGPMRWVELTPPGAQTRVVLLGEGNPAFEPDRIGKGIAAPFEVNDFDATCAALKARGVEFRVEPQKQPWGCWAEIVDVDGNVLGLHADR
jgi:predicted enzyme related to lactoylglutathione lyase